MYEAFYNFRERPFSLTPDPRYLFLSERHREALAHLLYGIRQRCGFVLLTGEVGTGKTTLCRALIKSLDADTEVALILNPNVSAVELLQTVNREFDLPGTSESRKALVDELNAHLLARRAAGKNLVLIVDEAQNLPPLVLEELRLLSNLETETEKLLQIVLIGQPELNELLSLKGLRQLDQRMSVRYHLQELNLKETVEYIEHRLHVASESPRVKFSRLAVRRLYSFSKGAPRLVNVGADRALLVGFTRGDRRITWRIVGLALREIRSPRRAVRRRLLGAIAGASVAAVLLAATTFALWPEALRAVVKAASVVRRGATSALREHVASAPGRPEVREVRVVTPTSFKLVPESELPLAKTPEMLFTRLAEQDTPRAWASAVNELLHRWNAKMVSGADVGYDVSIAAEEAGLRCTRLEGSLLELTKINLPALTEVEIKDVGTRYVALVGYDGRGFITNLDPRTRVPVDALQPLWTGTAYVFWRDHQDIDGNLHEGSQGPAVLWLKNALTHLGFYKGAPTPEYDAELQAAVAALQAAKGLEPDGIVGDQTKMLLYSALESYSTPHLITKARAASPGGP
jgi:general secretion pathway protein A